MELLEILYRMNPWWRTDRAPEILPEPKIRHEFKNIKDLLPERRITAITGPRRVGKTTLIFRLIAHLLQSGVPSRRIFYCSGDEPGLCLDPGLTLGGILDLYFREALNEPAEAVMERTYILVDETHHFTDWSTHIGSFSPPKDNLKFVLTGFAPKMRESTLRMDEIFLYPFDFRQYLTFHPGDKVDRDLLGFQPPAPLLEDAAGYYAWLKSRSRELAAHEQRVWPTLKEYLLSGGYPGYFVITGLHSWRKYLMDNIITTSLYRDIIRVQNVKSPEVLEKLLFFTAANQGQTFAYTSIAETLGVDTMTVSSYINYLAQAYLVGVQENYAANPTGKIIRMNKKLHIVDNGIWNALLKIEKTDGAEEGRLFENWAIRNVKYFADRNRYNLYYWRYGTRDVDLVVDARQRVIPVSVKYRDNVAREDVKGLQAFMAKYGAKFGVMMTKAVLQFEERIYFIPYWMTGL